jgi:drug/metabolite transporter (DMT)-like permease
MAGFYAAHARTIPAPIWLGLQATHSGVGGISAHYCMAKSVSMADASVVMPINFLQLPAMAVAGLLLCSEGLDPCTLAGGLLILLAIYLNIVWSRRQSRNAAP